MLFDSIPFFIFPYPISVCPFSASGHGSENMASGKGITEPIARKRTNKPSKQDPLRLSRFQENGTSLVTSNA